ncbi:MAG: enoyl-CoA hydratase [Deltaproteobacteria bacterium]|nr:MAG: enoyl-CoA hydratase [Deltaproteobacteria bacterium]
MSAELSIERAERVTWIRFDRPAKKNALTLAMYREATEALREASTGSCRVVVIAGHPGAFSAGNDLSDFMQRQGELGAVLDFLDALVRCPKPIFAAVDGVAIGIGTTLLLHCDGVWATERSRFKTPFVDLGLVPEAASSLLLPQIVGPRVANDMLLSGRTLTGAEAERYGLINGLTSPEAIESLVGSQAQILAAKAPAAVRQSKALIRGAQQERVLGQLAAEAEVFQERLRSPEFQEAAAAFMQKRKPDFSRFD